MSVTITGQTAAAIAGQCITAQPSAWPILNAAGASTTDPGVLTTLTDAAGNYAIDVPPNTAMTIREPGRSHTGVTPAAGTHSTASLESGNGWTGA